MESNSDLHGQVLPLLWSWCSSDLWLADARGLPETGLLLPTDAEAVKWADAICTACSRVGLFLKWSIGGLRWPETEPERKTLHFTFGFRMALKSTDPDWRGYLPHPIKVVISQKKILCTDRTNPERSDTGTFPLSQAKREKMSKAKKSLPIQLLENVCITQKLLIVFSISCLNETRRTGPCGT